MAKVAVVIPTVRESSYKGFLKSWKLLFDLHNVELITVFDGDQPILRHDDSQLNIEAVMGKADADLILNYTPAVRNLGFAYIARFMPDVDYVITLDDDVKPCGDTIQQHLNALQERMPISWLSSTIAFGDFQKPIYMRGFPYEVRNEAEVVLSHGVHLNVPDLDAPTQLVMGEHPEVTYYRGPIPKGVEFQYCGMNLAFKRKAIPYIYYAPVAREKGVERMDDIFMGRFLKRKFDDLNWASVTGMASIDHTRASNVYKNLEREVIGIAWNENFWDRQEEPFFKMYREKRERWEAWVGEYL